MPHVHSSAISRIEYDPRTQVLQIWFHETGQYDYYGVPEHLYKAFLAARSKGQFYNDHIRDQYGR